MTRTSPDADAAPRTRVLRAEDALPDDKDRAEIGGVSVRKGTVAAFLQNAIRWTDAPGAPDQEELSREIVAAVPALRALGVFAVFEARDPGLRALMSEV